MLVDIDDDVLEVLVERDVEVDWDVDEVETDWLVDWEVEVD